MPLITLPDGSQRHLPKPVTVHDVAASIGAGLAKAALAGRVDGVSGRYVFFDRSRRDVGDRHQQG